MWVQPANLLLHYFFFDGPGMLPAFKGMRLTHSHFLMFAFSSAGLLYLGCSERDDVARFPDENAAGSDAGMASSSAGSNSSAAGSGEPAGGSEGSGAAGVGESGATSSSDAGQSAGGAGGDAEPYPGAATIIVAGWVQPQEEFVSGTLSNMDRVAGTAFVNGSWAPVKVLREQAALGTVGFLADGTGLAVMGATGGLGVASWDGQWSTAELEQGAPHGTLGRMTTFAGGAAVAGRVSDALAETHIVQLSYYDFESSTWTVGEEVGVETSFSPPAVAMTEAGEPLVVFYDPANRRYSWKVKTGGSWASPGRVPVDRQEDFGFAEIDLVKREGADEIIGIFASDYTNGDSAALVSSVFSDGLWSPVAMIATDVNMIAQNTRRAYLSALPDGRVALAYWAVDFRIKIGFFDGSSWSEFKVVPNAMTYALSPIAISRGAPGAALELLFSKRSMGEPTGFELAHMRLTNEASWAWTEPQIVDDDYDWGTITIAAWP